MDRKTGRPGNIGCPPPSRHRRRGLAPVVVARGPGRLGSVAPADVIAPPHTWQVRCASRLWLLASTVAAGPSVWSHTSSAYCGGLAQRRHGGPREPVRVVACPWRRTVAQSLRAVARRAGGAACQRRRSTSACRDWHLESSTCPSAAPRVRKLGKLAALN